jgi:hypothetical protein
MSNIKHRINENTISKKVISDLNHYFSDLTAGSPTHKFAVREILKSALIDSNFHNLANKLDTLIPGAKWDEKEQGIPASSAIRLIKRKGEDVAKDSKWDAETIINSVSAYLVKTDSNTAKRVQSLKQDMNESMTSWISNYVSELSENDNPCWDGYEMVGMKTKDGKEVPNCVPKNESVKEATPEEEDEFHRNLDKLVHKTFGHSSDEKKMNEVDSTQLDKRKEQLLKKVEPLIAKKKKLYSDVDITTPMSADEKKLNKEIADIFSEIQSIIRQKRNLKKENKHIKEGNAFTGALYKARKEGLKEFEFNGKKYPVYEETENLLGENVSIKKDRSGRDTDNLIVNLNGNQYEIAYSADGWIHPYGIAFPGDSTYRNISKDTSAKKLWLKLKPIVDKFLKSKDMLGEKKMNEAAINSDYKRVYRVLTKRFPDLIDTKNRNQHNWNLIKSFVDDQIDNIEITDSKDIISKFEEYRKNKFRGVIGKMVGENVNENKIINESRIKKPVGGFTKSYIEQYLKKNKELEFFADSKNLFITSYMHKNGKLEDADNKSFFAIDKDGTEYEVNFSNIEFIEKIMYTIKESSIPIYHNSFTDAVNTARQYVEKKGYEIDEDEWFTQIGTGGKYTRARPSIGKTHSFSVGLIKNGKPQKKNINISVYGMDSGRYELTAYIA